MRVHRSLDSSFDERKVADRNQQCRHRREEIHLFVTSMRRSVRASCHQASYYFTLAYLTRKVKFLKPVHLLKNGLRPKSKPVAPPRVALVLEGDPDSNSEVASLSTPESYSDPQIILRLPVEREPRSSSSARRVAFRISRLRPWVEAEAELVGARNSDSACVLGWLLAGVAYGREQSDEKN